MGDPTFGPGLVQDVGNATKTGIFPRLNTGACASYSNITKSFCNSDDRFCDSGNSIAVHLSYVKIFGKDAADFIVSRVVNDTKQ
jgi:hypothetical protein